MIEELTNPYFLLAFVVAPLAAVGFGLVLMLTHEHDMRKRRCPPGE